MLRVAWLASGFIGRSASGTAQTARKIVEYLLITASDSIEVSLILKSQSEFDQAQKDPVLNQAKLILLPGVKGRFFRSSRQFYRFARLHHEELFDILHFSVPRVYPFYWQFPAKHFVCTFHAAGDITVKQDKFVFSKHLYNAIMRLQWRHLDRIYSDSDFASQEISDNYFIPKDRVTMIPLGADQLWECGEVPSPLLDLERMNIVIVGRWQNYKNVHSAIEAIRTSNDKAVLGSNVVLIGKSTQMGNSEVKKALARIGPERVTCVDYVSDDELKFIYRRADLVIHPSINEGFGLPAFEAFGEGASILVHENTPAADYLRSCQGVYTANLLRIPDFRDAISRALIGNAANLNDRRDYLSSKRFIWAATCQAYVDSYKNLTYSE